MPVPDPSYTTKVYEADGGDRQVIAGGGTLDIQSGAAVLIAGSDKTAALAAAVPQPVAGVAGGCRIACGEAALDGGNPTPVATGLTTVLAFTATLKGGAAPGVGTSILTADLSGTAGTVHVYAWRVSGAANATLVASTGTESFLWIAVGT